MKCALMTPQLLLMALTLSTRLAGIRGASSRNFFKGSANLIDASVGCADKPNWTVLPHAHDCKKFYTCANGMPEEYSCLPGYYFDRALICCMRGLCPYSEATPPAVHAEQCQAHVARVEGNCHVYKLCIDGTLLQKSCMHNYYFDPATGACLRIDNTPGHKCSCLLPDHTAIINPNNCETYYVCSSGKAVLWQCPRGEYYDERTNSCLPDLTGICLMAPTMGSAELTTSDMCAENASAGGSIFRPNAADCSNFYMCVNGHTFLKHCPNGLYFDSQLNHCRSGPADLCFAHLQTQLPMPLQSQQRPQQQQKPQKELLVPLHLLPPKKFIHGQAHKKYEKSQAHSLSLSSNKREEPIHETAPAATAPAMQIGKHKEDPEPIEPKANVPPFVAAAATVIEAAIAGMDTEQQPQQALMVNESETHVAAAEHQKDEQASDEEAKQDVATQLQVELPTFSEMTQPQQKPPTKPTYDKLASKFMEF